MNGLISILLPTYNRAHMLSKCIDSILDQSYTNWELIISDDASSDDTSIVSEEYVNKDPRIIYNKNSDRLGLPANRNVLITISRGKFVFFVEDDLVLDKDCLRILVNTFAKLKRENKNIGAIAPRLILVDEERFNQGPLSLDDRIKEKNYVCLLDSRTGLVYRNFGINADLIEEVPDVHSCSFYPKKVLQEVGGYEENKYKGNYTCEEVDLNSRIRKLGYNLYFQSKSITYHYKSMQGGVRLSSPVLTNYYMIRNHTFFLLRNFGLKSIYMVPSFLIYTLYLKVKHSLFYH